MSFYSNLAATASRLLIKYGATVTLVRKTDSYIDPVTGDNFGSDTELTTKGVLKPYPDNLIDGTRITSSMRILVLPDTIEPLLSDKVLLSNQQWAIEEIKTISPAGLDLVYMLRVNK